MLWICSSCSNCFRKVPCFCPEDVTKRNGIVKCDPCENMLLTSCLDCHAGLVTFAESGTRARWHLELCHRKRISIADKMCVSILTSLSLTFCVGLRKQRENEIKWRGMYGEQRCQEPAREFTKWWMQGDMKAITCPAAYKWTIHCSGT